MAAISELLFEYGPWALSAILMVVVRQMWKYIEKRNAYIDQLHREQRDDSKEMVEALITTRGAVSSFKEVLNAVLTVLTSRNPPA